MLHTSSLLATEVGMGTWAKVGLGALAAAGIGLALGGGKSGGSGHSDNNASQSQPNEGQESKVEQNLPTTEEPKSDPAPELPKAEEPKLDIPPKTEIATPIIHFDNITTDNVINAAESQQTLTLSGTVENAPNGSTLNLHIGETTLHAQVNNGEFSVQAEGSLLAKGSSISADIQVHDDAGNTAQATQNHSYTVQAHIEQPTITINNIAEDNIINATEAKGNIEVSGTVQNVENGQQIIVQCTCPSCTAMRWIEAHGTVQDGKFKVDLNAADLAGLNTDTQLIVKAIVHKIDNAGNTADAEAEKPVQWDTVAPTPQVTINPINEGKPLNLEAAKNAVVFSGSLSYDADVRADSVKVTVMLNGKEHNAVVDGKNWSFSLAGAEATATQGENNLTVKVSVYDQAGNQGTTEKTQTFQVDTIAPQVQITLNHIADDDMLSVAEQKESVQISGNVTGEFKAGDMVHLTADGKAIGTATVDQNGNFTAQVAGSELAHHQSVTATIQTTDAAGNTGSANTSHNYTVKAEQHSPLHIQLDQIANDNLINVTEALQKQTTISGKVSGDGAKVGDNVQIHINGENFTATVKDDLSFKVDVSTEKLLKNPTFSVTANLNGTNSEAQTYQVSPEASAKVNITEINGNHSLSNSGARIEGEVTDFKGLFAKSYNKGAVLAVKVNIGDKTYEVGG